MVFQILPLIIYDKQQALDAMKLFRDDHPKLMLGVSRGDKKRLTES
jgi:hypothetical protein